MCMYSWLLWEILKQELSLKQSIPSLLDGDIPVAFRQRYPAYNAIFWKFLADFLVYQSLLLCVMGVNDSHLLTSKFLDFWLESIFEVQWKATLTQVEMFLSSLVQRII